MGVQGLGLPAALKDPAKTSIYVGPTCGTWALQRIDGGGLGKMQELEFRVERN